MTDYSAQPMYAYAWSDPHVDLENPRFVISVEWTWPTGDWSHFSLVRSTRSSVRRREEGQVMMTTKGKEWDQFAWLTTGLPVYQDPQPPPGEWVYYTAFVLDPNRVWVNVGSQFEVSIADYDWALQLPELLPGVSIGDMARTISPAEQSNPLVTFLQTPGALLDKVVTMGEAAQYFWDPLRVPPQMLKPMVESIGYFYDDSLGIGRTRYVIDALMGSTQGSLPSIRRFVEGATGCDARVEISNNLMLDTNDSSFESGLLVHPITGATVTKWQPLANLELRKYENWPDKFPTLHPNVQVEWFLYLKAAGTYTCGPNYTGLAPNEVIIQQGIPVSTWYAARMGVHALKPSPTAVTLSMGLKVYDYLGGYLRNMSILPTQTLTEDWKWYGSAVAGVMMPRSDSAGAALLKASTWWVDSSELVPSTITNLLTANQASVESNTVGFVVGANCTLSQNVTQAVDGFASLGMTAIAAASMNANTTTGTGGVPVTAGGTYTATASFRTIVSSRSVELAVNWYTSDGTFLSKSTPVQINSFTTAWMVATTTVVAPATAAFVAVNLSVPTAAAGEVHLVDKVGLWKGPSGGWAMPGEPIQDHLPDLTGKGKDLIFGAGNGSPVVLPYTGTPYVSIPTTSGNTVSIAMTNGLSWTATRLDGTTITGTHTTGTFTFSTAGSWKRIATTGGAFILDPSDVDASYSTIRNSGTAGGTWAIGRAATGSKVAVVDRPLLQFGGSQIGQTATMTTLPVGTFLMALRHYRDSNTNSIAKTETVTTTGFQIYMGSGNETFNTKVGTGTATFAAPNQGSRIIGLTYDGTTVKQYQDGALVASAAATGVFLKDLMIIGGPTVASFQFLAAALWDRVLTTTEIVQASAELPNHASLPAAYAVPWITVSNPCSVDLIVVDDG